MQLKSLTFLAGLTAVLAAPAIEPTTTADLDKRATCTFTGTTGAAAAKASKASCSTITLNGLTVPAGQTLDLTGLKAGTKVIFEGTTKWAHKEWEGPLVSVSGSGITVSGASGAVLDGQGALWWDGKGDSGVKKPKFFAAHDMTGNSLIENIKILNPPHQVFSINGAKDLTLNKVTIDARSGDTNGGHNTDCFDIGSSDGVTITGATCYNQDDCVAVNSGTNIVFSGGLCSGGHGLSIGSVGGRSDNVVKDVTFKSSTIQNSENGVRVKTIAGATGSVSGVTYESITLSNISKYGVLITQAYNGDSPTTGVPITDLTLNGVTGTTASGATANIEINCGKGSCSGWSWSNVKVSGTSKKDVCTNVPSGITC